MSAPTAQRFGRATCGPDVAVNPPPSGSDDLSSDVSQHTAHTRRSARPDVREVLGSAKTKPALQEAAGGDPSQAHPHPTPPRVGQRCSLAFDAEAACTDQTQDYGRFLNSAHMTGPQGGANIKHSPAPTPHTFSPRRRTVLGLLLGLMEVNNN